MKKLLSLVLSIILILSCMGVVSAKREEDEKKTYIVLLEAPAVYSPERITFYGVDDDMYREALLELQAEVRAQIDGTATYSLRNRERTYTYTDVINGFTVKVDAATAEKIKKIDGVKGVYEDKTVDTVEPLENEDEMQVLSDNEVSLANSGNMMKTDYAYNKGYNGEGRAIAIIDSTINPDHVYYKLSDETTAKYTKDEIGEILENNIMNISATADNAYKNAKIPFAFNYPNNSDTVTGANLHGAHVAGIAAGNSVTVSDGIIQGIAPEAQILFFSVHSDEGAQTSDIIAALEDAVKFDVDAINLSMGAVYASEYVGVGPFNDAVIACRNSGKTVVFAAGNSDRASHSALMFDYGTSDNRNYLYSSKVGSVQSQYAYMNYLEDDKGNKYPCAVKGDTSALSALSVADCGTGTQAEINAAGVLGKIAFISMPDAAVASGLLTYGKKAIDAGAAAVVVANSSVDISTGNSGVAYPLFLVANTSAVEIRENATTLKYTQ